MDFTLRNFSQNLRHALQIHFIVLVLESVNLVKIVAVFSDYDNMRCFLFSS